MNYPIYNKSDLHFAERDGNQEVIEFADFISQLINADVVDHPVEEGIISLVNDVGTQKLTLKQSKVLEKIVYRYSNTVCRICGENISLSDALFLDGKGLCIYHNQQLSKEDD